MPRWQAAWHALPVSSRDAIAGFVLAAALARERNRGDLELVRGCLRVAHQTDLLAGPAPRHTLTLLRRAADYAAVNRKARAIETPLTQGTWTEESHEAARTRGSDHLVAPPEQREITTTSRSTSGSPCGHRCFCSTCWPV